jgi:integrase
MSATKLTKAVVERLAAPDPSGKQVLVFDVELRGFGVLVSGTTTSKSYFAQHRTPGASGPKRINIGSVASFLSVEEARRRAGEMIRALAEGHDPKAERRAAAVKSVTLRQVLERYLETNRHLRAKTAEMYTHSVTRHLANWLDRPVREITREMVEDAHARIGKTVGHASANGALRVLRALYNDALDRDGSLPANPVRVVKRRMFPVAPRTRHIKTDDLAAFVRGVRRLENTVARDYLLTVFLTGLRRREASAMRWDEVDWTTGTIHFPGSRLKSGRSFDLPVTRQLCEVLMSRRTSGSTSPWVFPAHSKSGHIEEPKFAIKEACEAEGIPLVAVHDLRRTWITVAEAADISETALKALAQHSLGGMGVTGQYVQMVAERLRAPAQRVADSLCALAEWGEKIEGLA